MHISTWRQLNLKELLNFRNVMIMEMMVMELLRRQCAGHGLSQNATQPTLKVPQEITNQTPGVRRCLKRFVLLTIATWSR